MQLNAKTGYIKLQVPPKKLGAVLSAIGAALDGHPWTPHTPPKAMTRGCRGGRGKREKRHVEPNKGKHVAFATNPLEGSSVGGVPQLPTSHELSMKAHPSILKKPLKKSTLNLSKSPVINSGKAAIQVSNCEASKQNEDSAGAGRRAGTIQFGTYGSSTSDDRAPHSGETGKGSDVPTPSTYAEVARRHSFKSHENIVVRDIVPSKEEELEELKSLLVSTNQARRKRVCELYREPSFRPKKSRDEYSFFGKKTTVITESDNDYNTARATALKLHYAKHMEMCTACRKITKLAIEIKNNQWDKRSHLADCGNTCECPASTNRRYLELLGKHRRCFTASSARESRIAVPTAWKNKR